MARQVIVAGVLVLSLAAAACGGGGDEVAGNEPIEFWTTQIEPDRVEVQRRMIADFSEQSGTQVELVTVAEDELPSLIVANAASGTLPEVIYHPVDFAIGWEEQGLLDTAAAAAVLDSLGRDTFNQQALELATSGDQVASVPADGWGQLLIYRTDLFEEAGLAPPDSYEAILQAAQTLHDPENNLFGITASTDPADVFTQQTFEHFALANGCQLVDEAGASVLGSPECVEAIATYQELINSYSPGSVQNVDTTRATYFAGRSAMLIWSPLILDELAGLRQDALPNCPQCVADQRFLASNSGFVPAFSGEAAEAAQWGQISYFGIGTGSDTQAAQEFVEYLLSDGYLDWLGIAPEGQFPMRRGTAEEPERYIDAWRDLEFGVDDTAVLTDVYGEEVIDLLTDGTENFERWGLSQGYGSLVSTVYESLIVPQAIASVVDGSATPEETAEQLQAEVSEQIESLPEPED